MSTNTTTDSYQNIHIKDQGRIERLDGFRGLLCLIVVLHHYYLLPMHDNPGEEWNWWLKILFQSYGVIDGFFALSGWLIGTILLENKNSPHFFKTFYIRRAFRVLPLYFITVGVYLLLSKTVESDFPWLFNDPLTPLWSYPFALQSIFGGIYGIMGDRFIYFTWSLALEFHFYIIAPFIVRYFSRRNIILLYIALCALAVYLRFLIPGEGHVWMRTLLFWRPEAVFGGLVLSYFTSDPAFTPRKYRWTFWLIWLFLIPGVVLCAFDHYMGVFLYPWFSLTFLVFFTALFINPSFLKRFFELNIFQNLGHWSYSIYLCHMPVLGFFFYLFYHRPPDPYTTEGFLPGLLCLTLTLVLGWLSYNFIEKPFLKLGKKFTYA